MKYSLGIDIGGTKCAVILGRAFVGSSKENIVLKRISFRTQETGDAPAVIAVICAGIDAILQEYKITAQDIIGIGISCGGPLDSKKGVILNPPNLYGWINVPICEILEEKYGLPAKLENDANACAVAEWVFGAARGYNNMAFLTFGTGLGAGLILDGKLYRGASGMAGEVGHVRLAEFGPVGYGKAGSFEGFCSGGGIAGIARMKVREKLQLGEPQGLCQDISQLDTLDAKIIADAADAGDPLAREIYNISGEYLGKGLSVLIDILNPDIIVLGSIFARSSHLLWPRAEEVIERESLYAARSVCKVVPAQLGDDIGDYAAISLAIYNFGKETKDGWNGFNPGAAAQP